MRHAHRQPRAHWPAELQRRGAAEAGGVVVDLDGETIGHAALIDATLIIMRKSLSP
jgi:hypothetical protein